MAWHAKLPHAGLSGQIRRKPLHAQRNRRGTLLTCRIRNSPMCHLLAWSTVAPGRGPPPRHKRCHFRGRCGLASPAPATRARSTRPLPRRPDVAPHMPPAGTDRTLQLRQPGGGVRGQRARPTRPPRRAGGELRPSLDRRQPRASSRNDGLAAAFAHNRDAQRDAPQSWSLG